MKSTKPKSAKDMYAAMMVSPARPSMARDKDKTTKPKSDKDIKLSESMFQRGKKVGKKSRGGDLSKSRTK
jgi:hypothetical protein